MSSGLEVLGRAGKELDLAACAAEKLLMASVISELFGADRIHQHATDRIPRLMDASLAASYGTARDATCENRRRFTTGTGFNGIHDRLAACTPLNHYSKLRTWVRSQAMLRTVTQRTASNSAPRLQPEAVTIGALARAAEVGVETVRYYQRRRLLPVPSAVGTVRRYPRILVDRIRFIKRSQDLGFSLEEIRELMRLEEGGSRSAIRKIAGARLGNIRGKISDLRRMELVLSRLLHECEHADSAAPCPIIAALRAPRPQSEDA